MSSSTYGVSEVVAAEDVNFCYKSNQGWQKTIYETDEKESIQYECIFALEHIADAIKRLIRFSRYSRINYNVLFAQLVISFFSIKEEVVITLVTAAYIDARRQFRLILEDEKLTIIV